YTRLEIKPGNLNVPLGTDQEVICKFDGLMPVRAELSFRSHREPAWKTVALTEFTKSSSSHLFKALVEDVEYRFAANDAVSENFSLKTYVAPHIASCRCKIRPPS